MPLSRRLGLNAASTLVLLLLGSLLPRTVHAQARCDCFACTDDILTADARGQTCESRIDEAISGGATELDACADIATRYPMECGPECHPTKCDDQAPAHCSCEECTDEVWETSANGFTCGQRVLFLLATSTEDEACARVSGQYPEICGTFCHPDTCASNNVQPSAPPSAPPSELPPSAPVAEHCGCLDCTDAIWGNDAGGFTCGDRIAFLQTIDGGDLTQEQACTSVGETWSYSCGPQCNPTKCDGRAAAYCGCPDCELTSLQFQAGTFTCAQRITELRRPEGDNRTEVDACAMVANQFESCGESCDPTQCPGGPLRGVGELDGGSASVEREGVPWAWAVLGANALFVLIIFLMYRKW